jgi:hypothetical protein
VDTGGTVTSLPIIDAPIQPDGSIATALWANKAGTGGTHYRVVIADDSMQHVESLANIEVGLNGPYNLGVLLAEGNPVVPSNQAPTLTTAPTITPLAGQVGTEFVIGFGVYGGTPQPTIIGTLTQNGVDVTAQMLGDRFTSTAVGPLVWSVVASNGVSPSLSTSASATINPVVAAGQDIYVGTEQLFAGADPVTT